MLLPDMPRFHLLLILLLILTVITPLTSSAQDILAQYRWQNRVVILFADGAGSEKAAGFLASLAERQADFIDRDMLLITVYPDKAENAGEAMSAQEANALQSRYNQDNAIFRVLLIGKDGGVKLNRVKETALQDLFDLIDTMPMRRQEMRQKKSG